VAVKNWVDIKAILATGQCLLFCNRICALNSRAFAAFENHVNKTFFKVLASLVIMKHIGLFF
jgi:hypothetical protein